MKQLANTTKYLPYLCKNIPVSEHADTIYSTANRDRYPASKFTTFDSQLYVRHHVGRFVLVLVSSREFHALVTTDVNTTTNRPITC